VQATWEGKNIMTHQIPADEGQARILVVEDESIIAMDIAMQLRELGYQVVGHASSGEQAITMAEQLRPDLVLMDVQLKGTMDGIEAAQVIRTRFNLPCLFLSAFANDTDNLARAAVAAPVGYLAKPFFEHELRAVVQLALGQNASGCASSGYP
jgi:CheY-like chemotaxis protein